MKLIKKSSASKSPLYGGSGNQSMASWAETNPGKFRTLSKQAKLQSRRAPELWIAEDQPRVVRFLDEEPVVTFEAYRMKVRNKWERYIRPKVGETDLFDSVLGLRPSRMFVWRVIDVDGYTNSRTNKTVRNVPRFYVVGARGYDQIKLLADENADEKGALTEYDVRIVRSGTSTNTQYMYVPRKACPLTPEMKKAAATFPKWQDYYRPLSEEEQRGVVAVSEPQGD